MILRSLRVGFFLMLRYIKRGSIWTSILIITIMFLTFLNVVVVRGILVGLPVGATSTYKKEYSGDVIITPLPDQYHIDRTMEIEKTLPSIYGFDSYASRYMTSGVLVANYSRPKKESLIPDQVGVALVGVNPGKEDVVTGLSKLVVEGRYFTGDDRTGVLLGSQLLERYVGGTPEAGGTPETTGSIKDVYPGDTVKINIGNVTGEYTVVGVVKSKVGENSRRVFMLDKHLRKVINRSIDKKDEIAVRLKDGVDSGRYVEALIKSGAGEHAVIQTAKDAQGKFLDDIKETFDMLGNGIGLMGVIVAAITVFIMIFIVALNRQKQIGILKGIGINKLAIESSYVFLSILYAVVGISLGTIVLYVFIAPYLAVHPIDFPFAEGALVVPWNDTLVRSFILVFTTLLAGYLPARMIVQKNTINSILGR